MAASAETRQRGTETETGLRSEREREREGRIEGRVAEELTGRGFRDTQGKRERRKKMTESVKKPRSTKSWTRACASKTYY